MPEPIKFSAEFHGIKAWKLMWHNEKRLACILMTNLADNPINIAIPPEVALQLGQALVKLAEKQEIK